MYNLLANANDDEDEENNYASLEASLKRLWEGPITRLMDLVGHDDHSFFIFRKLKQQLFQNGELPPLDNGRWKRQHGPQGRRLEKRKIKT